MTTQLIRGRQETPDYGIIMGTPGTGKSSFVGGWTDMKTGQHHNGAPNPVLLGPERNPEVECVKFPNTDKNGIPLSYDDYINQLKEIRDGKHDSEGFESLGLDSVDMLEKRLHDQIVAKANGFQTVQAMNEAIKLGRVLAVPNIDAFSYGAGRKQAFAEMVRLEALLNEIHDTKQMNVWIIGHCTVRTVNNPMAGTSYDSYEMSLHKSTSGKMDVSQIFTEKVSTILFANQKILVTSEGKAMGSGERALYTEFRPGHLGKNRYGLPYELPLFYDQYAYGKKLFFQCRVSDEQLQNSVKSEINSMKYELDDLFNRNQKTLAGIRTQVYQSWSMANGNVNEYKRILNKVKTMIQ